jgi:hypothetical protein
MLDQPSFWLDLIKQLGISALIFLIWYLYHRSQVQQWQRLMDAQQQREERNFELLKDMLETVQYHTGMLARVETKIDTNQFCPLTKKESNRA